MSVVEISCDLGEAATAEERAIELALWTLVDAANVACGGHAGDDASMREAVALAKRYGVRLGAHPSFPDRDGFGRRRIDIGDDDLVTSLSSQIESLRLIAASEGVSLDRVKAHGALYNLAHHDIALARILTHSMGATAPGAALVCAAESAMETAARERHLGVIREAFADRRYRPNCSLVPRGEPGALLEDLAEAAAQAVALATRHSAIASDGSEIEVPHDTLCIHSDMSGSVARLHAIRVALASAGVRLGR